MIVAECRKKEYLMWALEKAEISLVVSTSLCNQDFLLSPTLDIVCSKNISDACDIFLAPPEVIGDITELPNIVDFYFFLFHRSTFWAMYPEYTPSEMLLSIDPMNLSQDFEKRTKKIISQLQKAIRKIKLKYPSPRNSHIETKEKSPQEILCVSLNPSDEELEKAKRELSLQCHPDKVAHLHPDFAKLANKKMLEINQAYDTLKQKRAK